MGRNRRSILYIPLSFCAVCPASRTAAGTAAAGSSILAVWTRPRGFDRIALIGLRGAGKSTLGANLAAQLEVPFFELDRLIEQESGVSLSVIFDLYGQSGFRRLERRCLDSLIDHIRVSFSLREAAWFPSPPPSSACSTMCYTVWLKASPEDHMQRVIAQGDMRPMADNRESMQDLQRILDAREPLYRKADATIDTTAPLRSTQSLQLHF